MDDLLGARITPLSPEAVAGIVSWYASARDQLPSALGAVTGTGASAGAASAEIDAVAWVLARQDDGVVWGRVQGDGTLVTGEGATVPKRDAARLRELRCFSERAEVVLWRDDDGIVGLDVGDADPDALDEAARPQDGVALLLGERATRETSGSLRMTEGGGMTQYLPHPGDAYGRYPVRLRVRSYLREDAATGALGLGGFRLVGLERCEHEGTEPWQ